MFISFIKILSTVGLLIVFVVFATNRDITVTHSKKAILKSTRSEELLPIEEPRKAIVQSSPVQVVLATTTKVAPQVPTNNIPRTSSPVKKVAEIARTSVYVPLDEGRLDTEASYRPAVSPCNVTMGYTIGTFDTHFGISKETFLQEIGKASSVWENQVGKKLFTNSAMGPLVINLIYDDRQARTDEVNNLVLEIENSKATAETLKNTYETEKKIYLGDGEQLTKDGEAFTARYDAYAAKVTMYNNQGGAPADVYNQLTQEVTSLKQESKDLNARRASLLLYMDTINAKVNRYNELVVYINSLITKSNALGANKFTEGRFTPRTNTIDIYQFNDPIKLRRVLTHELGHVLGINHNDNVYSIMYASNSATTTALSYEDIQSLSEVCPEN